MVYCYPPPEQRGAGTLVFMGKDLEREPTKDEVITSVTIILGVNLGVDSVGHGRAPLIYYTSLMESFAASHNVTFEVRILHIHDLHFDALDLNVMRTTFFGEGHMKKLVMCRCMLTTDMLGTLVPLIIQDQVEKIIFPDNRNYHHPFQRSNRLLEHTHALHGDINPFAAIISAQGNALTTLSLAGNDLSTASLASLLSACCSEHSKIKSLGLADTMLGDVQLECAHAFMTSPNFTATYVNLCANPFTTRKKAAPGAVSGTDKIRAILGDQNCKIMECYASNVNTRSVILHRERGNQVVAAVRSVDGELPLDVFRLVSSLMATGPRVDKLGNVLYEAEPDVEYSSGGEEEDVEEEEEEEEQEEEEA